MSRILIIGSEGQLGSELSNFLKDKKDTNSIILSDIKENSSSSLKYVQLDAMNYSELEKTVKDFKISEIYHLAAILSARGEENPMLPWDLNIYSLFNVLELAKKKLVKKTSKESFKHCPKDEHGKRRSSKFNGCSTCKKI